MFLILSALLLQHTNYKIIFIYRYMISIVYVYIGWISTYEELLLPESKALDAYTVASLVMKDVWNMHILNNLLFEYFIIN